MKTAVIEGRVDVRDLATCADYFIKQGIPATSKSDLMFKVLTTFAHASWEQGARKFTGTEEAVGYMQEVGLGQVNRIKGENGRRANSWTLIKALKEEGGDEFAELAKEANKRMAQVDSDIPASVRAQRASAESTENADRMKDFISGIKGET
jgi:hypothetical protein